MIQTIQIFFSLFDLMNGVNKSYPKQQRDKPNIYQNAMEDMPHLIDTESDDNNDTMSDSESMEEMPPHLIDNSDNNSDCMEYCDHAIISRYCKTKICCPLDNRRKKRIMRQINEQLFFDDNNIRIYLLKKNVEQMYYVVVADIYQNSENKIPHYYDEEYKTKEIEEMSQ